MKKKIKKFSSFSIALSATARRSLIRLPLSLYVWVFIHTEFVYISSHFNNYPIGMSLCARWAQTSVSASLAFSVFAFCCCVPMCWWTVLEHVDLRKKKRRNKLLLEYNYQLNIMCSCLFPRHSQPRSKRARYARIYVLSINVVYLFVFSLYLCVWFL